MHGLNVLGGGLLSTDRAPFVSGRDIFSPRPCANLPSADFDGPAWCSGRAVVCDPSVLCMHSIN